MNNPTKEEVIGFIATVLILIVVVLGVNGVLDNVVFWMMNRFL